MRRRSTFGTICALGFWVFQGWAIWRAGQLLSFSTSSRSGGALEAWVVRQALSSLMTEHVLIWLAGTVITGALVYVTWSGPPGQPRSAADLASERFREARRMRAAGYAVLAILLLVLLSGVALMVAAPRR